MTTVVLVAIAAWLVLSALVAAACALVARGGLREDRQRLDRDLASLLEREGDVPRPRAPLR
jgi:hypothetical protein